MYEKENIEIVLTGVQLKKKCIDFRAMSDKILTRTQTARVKGMIAVRDSARKLIELQLLGASDGEIKEEQAKLGYMKEKISLYYPLSSLNHFFGNETDAAGMMEILKDFPSYIEEKFGEVAVSHRGDRFCFTVSEKASEYVHNNMKENEFIKALIELVGRHGCTIEEIKELFHSYSDKIITEPMDNEEFDVMIRFDDGSDPYYYCFKDEGCHIIYHRFLPEDYADFGF